jgi:hypothetical protein
MQSNTTGLSMELIFDMIFCFLLFAILASNRNMSKKIENIESNIKIIDEELAGDLEGIEKALVLLSQKIDVLPDTIKEDFHRTSLALRETLETARPIKPNNWDSVKEAFKGPVRIEINERN